MARKIPDSPPRLGEDELKGLNADELKQYKKVKEAWENYLQSETAEERFIRVGKPRVERLINNLDVFGKMVKSPRYDIPEPIFNKIVETLLNTIQSIQGDYLRKSGTSDDSPSVTDKIFGE